MNKKGAIELSFGMIFGIILIVLFLAFGFYAIKKFIELQDTVKVEQFVSEFEQDVENLWKKTQGSENFTYYLPTHIEQVCFQNSTYENLILISTKSLDTRFIEHLNIEKIVGEEDKYCVDNVKGKVHFIIEKKYGENLVIVKR